MERLGPDFRLKNMNLAERYARQIALPEIGAEGQRRLSNAAVLVVGVGGLGCPVTLYLTAAGVGRIGLMDADTVSESNLQRQILYTEQDVGMPKTEAARRRLTALSSVARIETHFAELTTGNAEETIAAYDLVVECSDNYATRYLVDDVCATLGKPWVYGSIGAFTGQVSLFLPGSQRYVDLYPASDGLAAAPRATGGVLGPVSGVVGAIEAAEAIKYLTGCNPTLAGRLLTIDLLSMSCTTFSL